MNETTKNFLEAIQNYKPPETKPVVWKLLYDVPTGNPIDVTTLDTVDCAYIEITADEAKSLPQFNPRVRVKDNEIIFIELECDKHKEPESMPVALVRSDDGIFVSDPWNMLFVSKEGNKWNYARRC